MSWPLVDASSVRDGSCEFTWLKKKGLSSSLWSFLKTPIESSHLVNVSIPLALPWTNALGRPLKVGGNCHCSQFQRCQFAMEKEGYGETLWFPGASREFTCTHWWVLPFLYLLLPHPGLWGGAVHTKSGFQVSFLCQFFLETPHGHIQMWPTE